MPSGPCEMGSMADTRWTPFFFQLVLVVHGIEPIPGKAVERFPDQNNIKQLLVAVLYHLLELRAIIRLGRDGAVNVIA